MRCAPRSGASLRSALNTLAREGPHIGDAGFWKGAAADRNWLRKPSTPAVEPTQKKNEAPALKAGMPSRIVKARRRVKL